MACDQCGKPRGHWPGCPATEGGKQKGAGHPRGRSKKLTPRDIPSHDHQKALVRTVSKPKGLTRVEITKIYWCSICHVDMGSDTSTQRR